MHHEEDLQKRIQNSWCKQTCINSITSLLDTVFCPVTSRHFTQEGTIMIQIFLKHKSSHSLRVLPLLPSGPALLWAFGMADCFLSPWARQRTKDKVNRQAISLLLTCTHNIQWKINGKEMNRPGVISHVASLLFSEIGPFWTHLRTLQLQSQWPHLSPRKCLPPVDLVDDVHLCLTRHPALKKEEKITDSDMNSEQA